MSKELMTFAQAVAKIIKLDMADDPEWRLSHVARLDAAFALREFSKGGNQYGRSNGLIDERALDAAAKYALEAQDRGDRFLKEIGVQQIIQAYLDALPAKFKDCHLENMISRCNEDLQNNRPVLAWTWLRDIKKHLIEKGVI